MEKFSLVWTKMICFGFMLLKIELTNGAVNIPTTGTPYIGDSFLLECHITPFTGTANWAKDGTTQTTCGTSFCAPTTLGNYSFSYDASGISVTIDPVSISDGGTWQCTHTSGTDGVTLSPTTKSEVTTTGSTEGPTTQTSLDYVVGGTTTTNFNVELISSTPNDMEEIIPISNSTVLMESPYDTNTEKTVILTYHLTDSLSIHTFDQSVKTITVSQSIPTTYVWDIAKSLRTDLYFLESSGLQVTSSDASIFLYDSISTQSLNQTLLLSGQEPSDEVSLESSTTQRNSSISFTKTDGFPISLHISYSSKYIFKSSDGISPLTVYPSSSLLRTDLFDRSSEVSKFEISNTGRLNTFSSNLESDFIDEITKTLKASNFLNDFSSSKSLVNDSVMQQNTNRQPVSTSDPFIASFLSSVPIVQKESEYSESYFSNYISILWTISSYQYVSDTFERPINTDKDPSYLLESTPSVTITTSFHTMTNLKDDETSTGKLETSLKITTLLSDYLVMDFQSNIHILSTDSSGYFVTTIQADIVSSSLKMEASHTYTSSNVTILHTSAIQTFTQTLQSKVTSPQIYSNSLMPSYWHYQSPDIERMSSYFTTSSETTEKPTSYTSYNISYKTLNASKDTFTGIAMVDEHLSTTRLSNSAIQTVLSVEPSIESSKVKIEFVTQTAETLFKSEYIEPGTNSLKYASTEATFHDYSLLYSSSSDFIVFTSGEFAPGISPASDIYLTSTYFTSTAIQNVISEQTKDIIVISTATSLVCFSVLILLILLFVKKHMQKPKPTIDIKSNKIEWNNGIQSNDEINKKVSTDSLYSGESLVFTRLNTKCYSYSPPYQHNWDDI